MRRNNDSKNIQRVKKCQVVQRDEDNRTQVGVDCLGKAESKIVSTEKGVPHRGSNQVNLEWNFFQQQCEAQWWRRGQW